MYLHFEDWTSSINLGFLKNKGLPYSDKIIKIYASQKHPKEIYKKDGLVVQEISGEPFEEDEEFTYENRKTYTGPELEQDLTSFGLNEAQNQVARALFRFANQHGFCQAAMCTKKEDGSWVFDHPFEDLHLVEGRKLLPNQESNIHLDIFYPPSLEKLKTLVDYENPNNVVTLSEIRELRRNQLRIEKENIGTNPERK